MTSYVTRAMFSTLTLAMLLQPKTVQAQLRLDGYRYLIRDVHPASARQYQYLVNRRLLTEVKLDERMERLSRSEMVKELKYIDRLKRVNISLRVLASGASSYGQHWETFWMLVGAYGGDSQVYSALQGAVEPLPDDEFRPAAGALGVVETSGELSAPPSVIAHLNGNALDNVRRTWTSLVESLNSPHFDHERLLNFQAAVRTFADQTASKLASIPDYSARGAAIDYSARLHSLAMTLNSAHRLEQLRACVQEGARTFAGGDRLALCQHMLKHGLVPVRGGKAFREVIGIAAPLGAALDRELARSRSRIDSVNRYEMQDRNLGSAVTDPATLLSGR